VTRSGVGAVLLGFGLLAVGRLLALLEITVVGLSILGLLLVTMFVSLRARPRAQITRTVTPDRVHVGDESEVSLDIVNTGRRPTPVLRIDDQVESAGDASLRIAPLAPGARARAAYRLPTEHRGLVAVGPLELGYGDPFGLTWRRRTTAGTGTLTVLPRVDELMRVPATSGHDPLSGRDHRHRVGDNGDDLYALRPYVPGDDLRRVSWRATARRDELIVRQDELPWQRRTTVLLDTRAETMEGATFERAVSAAASVIHRQRDDLVRLVSPDGYDTGFVAGHLAINSMMEYLAVATPVPRRSLRGLTERLGQSQGGGTLVMIVRLQPQDLDLPSRLRTRFGAVRPVVFLGPGDDPGEIGADPDSVIVEPYGAFATAWDRSVEAAYAHQGRAASVTQ
jgi:uncharacterized protein (DUF58 family)